MQEYRLFFFNNARLVHAHEFLADDDIRAIRVAEGWREGRAVELWNLDRQVRRWEADEPS